MSTCTEVRIEKHLIQPLEYRIAKGIPSKVEFEVRELIRQGFVLNGELMKYTPTGENNEILVQGMVRYDTAQAKGEKI